MVHAQETLPLYPGPAPDSKEHKGFNPDAFRCTPAPVVTGNARFVTRIIHALGSLTCICRKRSLPVLPLSFGGPVAGMAGPAIDNEGIDMANQSFGQWVCRYRNCAMGMADDVINKTIVPASGCSAPLQLVREHAVEWRINPHKVGIMGSSAGGHLASTAGTHYTRALIDNPKNKPQTWFLWSSITGD